MKQEPHLIPKTKINSKTNIKLEIIKLHKENMGKMVYNTGLDNNFLNQKMGNKSKNVCVCSVMSNFCDPMNYSSPGFSVHGIFQARILEWTTISNSRGSSQLRDQTHISCTFCTGKWFLNHCAPGKPQSKNRQVKLHQTKKFLSSKKINEVKQQPTEWENIFANPNCKGLIFKIYK